MNRVSVPTLLLGVVPGLASAADITDLSLESLLQTRVTSASKYEQELSDVPAAVSVITRDEIRAYGWRTLDQALASLPGIHTTYDRQYMYLGTRGFGLPGDFNTRLLLAINGNRINDPLYDSANLGRNLPLDLDLIERIEFIPGPGGAVYGQNAMFGVINVITRSGQQVDGWELTSAWQDPQDMREGRLRWGRRLADGTDILVSLAALRAEGDDIPMHFPGAAADGADLNGIARGLDGERDDEFSLRLGRGAWTFDAHYASRQKDDPTGAYFSDPFAPGQYETDDYVLTHLQYQRDIAADLNLRGRLFTGRQRYLGRFHYAPNSSFSTGNSAWHGGELRLLHTRFERHKLMFGLELQDNTRIDQSVDDQPPPLNITPVRGTAVSGADILIERDGYRAGLYMQDEWQLADTLTTSLGVRADRNDITGTHLSPRAALIWRATPTLTLKTVYGRANRAPNSYERDYEDGGTLVANPDLTRENIDTAEFVAEGRVASRMNLRASVYRWHVHELIRLATEPVSGAPQYQSGGKVEARGMELSANAALDSGARLRASVSWQDVADDAGAGLANSPRWLGRFNYARPLTTNFDLGLELQYDAERRAIDGTMLDAYWLANLNLVAGGFVSGLELSLTLLNLFDERYEHPAADNNWQNSLEQDGRAVRLRMDYRF